MAKQAVIEAEPAAIDERQEELDEASARLHCRLVSLIEEYGLCRQEVVDLLQAEEHWWAEDKFQAQEGGQV